METDMGVRSRFRGRTLDKIHWAPLEATTWFERMRKIADTKPLIELRSRNDKGIGSLHARPGETSPGIAFAVRHIFHCLFGPIWNSHSLPRPPEGFLKTMVLSPKCRSLMGLHN